MQANRATSTELFPSLASFQILEKALKDNLRPTSRLQLLLPSGSPPPHPVLFDEVGEHRTALQESSMGLKFPIKNLIYVMLQVLSREILMKSLLVPRLFDLCSDFSHHKFCEEQPRD